MTKKFVPRPSKPKKNSNRIQVYLGSNAIRFHDLAEKSGLSASELATQMVEHCMGAKK